MKAFASIMVLSAFAVASAPALSAPNPPARQKTSPLTVQATVSVNCTLQTSAFSFNIGIGYIHTPGNTILKQNNLNVKCTKGATTQIVMSSGLYGSAAGSQFGSRSMSDGSGSYLGYELCHDNACSSIWGASAYNYTSTTANGSMLPIWTRIKTGQPQVKQGHYTDAVTVTVSF